MKIADLCLACYDTPVSPGSRLCCPTCCRMREAPAARRLRRRIVWSLGVAVHLGLLGVAVWLGVRGLPRITHATPVEASNLTPVVAANSKPATPVESPPIVEPAANPVNPPIDEEEIEDV